MSVKNVPWLVSVVQPNGIEIDVILILEKKPTRIKQKLNTLTQYVQQHPSGWKKRLELAEILYQAGRWQEAIPEYHQVIEAQPQFIEVRLKLAGILQLMGQPADAEIVYQNALSKVRDEPTRQHINGLIAICSNEIKAAIESFESAAALEPENAVHWLALGRLQMRQKNASAALQAFHQILSLDPDNVVALIDSYDALMTLGNLETAEKQLKQLIQLAPDDFRVVKRQIECRCRTKLVWGQEGKQTKQMISLFRRRAGDAVDIYEILADYHLARGESQKAVEILGKFLRERPNHLRGLRCYERCLLHIEA